LRQLGLTSSRASTGGQTVLAAEENSIRLEG
jgi:hypothetical protein